MRSLALFVLLLASTFFGRAQQQPVSVIFDTDMGPDYDDVGAITILHAMADSGQANILATIASTRYEGVAEVLDVLNTYFKRPDIPIGVPRGKALDLRDSQHWSDTLRARYPHSVASNADVPDAVALYRKILAAQPDNSVTIITVGFFTNIAALMQSRPDTYSTLSGEDLVGRKVNRLVSMAGKFPEGKEFNVAEDAAASQYVFQHWRKPLLLSGFEIGEKIKSGLPLIHNDQIKNSPVKDVFRISIPLAKEDSAGRMSWDQTAVLAGIAGHDPYFGLEAGRMIVQSDGTNTWDSRANVHHRLVQQSPLAVVEKRINDLMMHQPK